ncbi:MAG TPA: hypothetical protein VFT04_08710 [Gemmatimonadales bacterium]|nr:hypothetical protein [Gemmatimonadales bacterium]
MRSAFPALSMTFVLLSTAASSLRAQTTPVQPGVPVAQSAEDERGVLAAIDTFLIGLRTQDTALMARQVDSLTRFTLLRPSPAGTRIMLLTPAQFMAAVTRPGQPALDEPIRNPVVHVDGDLASVWAEYQVRIDGRVSHCGFDAFHLARLAGRWKILNVSDTFRRAGCGDMWPAAGR